MAFVFAVVADSVPALLLKLTVAPGMAAPSVSNTVALMSVELKPSAVRLAAPVVTVTLPTVGATAPPTEYPVDTLVPVNEDDTVEGTDWTDALTSSAPDGALFAGDSVVVATPLTSVRAVVGFSCPYVGFVLKAITAPEMPSPAPSRNVAVTVALTPVEIELVERTMVNAGVPLGAAPPTPDVLSLQPARKAVAIANKNDTEYLVIF
jgi:hypothetical protein